MPVWSPSSPGAVQKSRRSETQQIKRHGRKCIFFSCRFLLAYCVQSNVMMMRCSRLLMVPVLFVSLSALHAQQPSTSGCTLERQEYYQCNHDAFQNHLNAAKAVHVDSGRMDVYGRTAVTKLVEGMGKTLVTPSQRADLTFQLTWIDRSGRIDFGPGDVAVARLNVYDPSRGAGERGLVWVETLTGKEDLPWPSMVEQLLQQFKTHFPK